MQQDYDPEALHESNLAAAAEGGYDMQEGAEEAIGLLTDANLSIRKGEAGLMSINGRVLPWVSLTHLRTKWGESYNIERDVKRWDDGTIVAIVKVVGPSEEGYMFGRTVSAVATSRDYDTSPSPRPIEALLDVAEGRALREAFAGAYRGIYAYPELKYANTVASIVRQVASQSQAQTQAQTQETGKVVKFPRSSQKQSLAAPQEGSWEGTIEEATLDGKGMWRLKKLRDRQGKLIASNIYIPDSEVEEDLRSAKKVRVTGVMKNKAFDRGGETIRYKDIEATSITVL
jgi:hypothetical protein